jgi:hypothetical protein
LPDGVCNVWHCFYSHAMLPGNNLSIGSQWTSYQTLIHSKRTCKVTLAPMPRFSSVKMETKFTVTSTLTNSALSSLWNYFACW